MKNMIDFDKLEKYIVNLFQEFQLPLFDCGVYFALHSNKNEIITIDWHYRNKNQYTEDKMDLNFDLDIFSIKLINILLNLGLDLHEVGITVFVSKNIFNYLSEDNKKYVKNEILLTKEYHNHDISYYVQFAINNSY